MSGIVPWILAGRPKTLPAAVVPVWVGCVLAYVLYDTFCVWLALATAASAGLIQIATNFFNDAIDFDKGSDTEKRLGPRRVTASGDLSAKAVMRAGIVTLLLACAVAVPMIVERGWPVLLIGLPSLYFSFGYTGGPLPLAYRGLGELFVVLFFGLIAVAGTVFVQSGYWGGVDSVVLGLQVGALSTVLIAVNNLRDREEDAGTGKRTLAVRFGELFGKVEIIALCLFPYALGIYWLRQPELEGGFWWPLAAAVPGLVVSVVVAANPPGPVYNKMLGVAALQLVLFAGLFHFGLL